MSIEDPNTPEVNENLTEDQIFSRMYNSIKDHDFEALDKLAKVELKEEAQPEVTEDPELNAEVPEDEEEVPATVEVQPEESTPAVVAGEEKPSDWTASLPKEAQEELNRLRRIEQQARSEAGRVPYLQKKLADLEKKLQSPQPSPTPVQTSGQPKDSTAEELEKILAEMKEVDPITTKALSLIREEALRTAKKTETILVQKDEEAHLAKEWNRLVEMIPQAPDVFKLPEWSMWKEEQAPGIKNLASSSYAEDVAFAVEKFAKDMAMRYPDLTKAPSTAPDAAPVVAAPVQNTPDPKQAAITEQRNRRLAATTPSSAAVAPKGDTEPKDPEALFRHFSAQVRKQYHLDKPTK